MSDFLLEATDLHVSYGAIKAIRGVSLVVRPGETVAVIGANGAGKTTLMRALSGVMPIAAGQARFDGRDIRTTPTHRLARSGLLHVPEGRGTIQTLSVADNLRLAWEMRASAENFESALTQVHRRFPRLAERSGQMAGLLSGGEQQMLALARAIINPPRLLLVDEPSLGLSPRLTKEVFQVLRAFSAEGVTILLVEQNVRAALALAHRAYVLTQGVFTAQGPAQELARDPAIVTSYLGHAPLAQSA